MVKRCPTAVICTESSMNVKLVKRYSFSTLWKNWYWIVKAQSEQEVFSYQWILNNGCLYENRVRCIILCNIAMSMLLMPHMVPKRASHSLCFGWLSPLDYSVSINSAEQNFANSSSLICISFSGNGGSAPRWSPGENSGDTWTETWRIIVHSTVGTCNYIHGENILVVIEFSYMCCLYISDKHLVFV